MSKNSKTDVVEELKNQILAKPIESAIPAEDFLSTGSTLLNLALTDTPWGGFAKGMYFFLVGDSDSGKTFLSLTCLAEAAVNPNFSNYRFILDNVEGGSLMHLPRFFGKQMADRLESPSVGENGEPLNSNTIEDFYYHLDDALNSNRPCIYVLDSMDSLSSESEVDKFAEAKKATRAGKDAKGSYGDGKAKKNASGIRQALVKLRDTGSILIIINQTRDNINAMAFGPTKTRSGGHALAFYAAAQCWSSIFKPIHKTVNGIKHQIGTFVRIKIKRTRFTGKKKFVDIPIYPSYGIDDISNCIDFLISTGHWKTVGQKIFAREFKQECLQKTLIRHIEETDSVTSLRKIVGEQWGKIEAQAALNRPPRYM